MRRVLAGMTIAAMALGVFGAKPADASAPTVSKVLIVAVPRLTWQAVQDAQPPNLMQLLHRSAVASMSLRTVSSRTTLGEGYATIGAGNRASVVDLTAGHGFDAAEQYEGAP